MNLKILTVSLVIIAAGLLLAGLLTFGISPGTTPGSEEPAAAPAAGALGDAALELPDADTADSKNEGEAHVATAAMSSSGPARNGASPEVGAAKSAREREAYINGMARSWAALEPLAALEQVRKLPDAESRDMAMLALLGEWSGMSAAEILRNGQASGFGIAGALGLYLMNNGRLSPAETAALANEYLSGNQRVGVLGRAAEVLAATDPAAAMALGDGLSGWQQTRFLARFAMGWAASQPEAAKDWAASIPDPRTRAQVMSRILEAEISRDPAQAAQSFAEISMEAPDVRARTARRIGEGWAGRDTVAAMQWAATLNDEQVKAAAQQGIAQAAPVGIGAMLSTGSDGVAVIGGLVPGSPAISSGSVNVGDRIIAVGGADGAWVDSRGVSIRELTSMIRGQPNTQVSLQVQSPGDVSPRVITLNRQQIIHRPE